MEQSLSKRNEYYSLLCNLQEINTKRILLDGLAILNKLITNIRKNPTENKYRVIKTTNINIANKLLAINGIDELLFVIGYELNNQGDYVLPISAGKYLDELLGVLIPFINNLNQKVYEQETALHIQITDKSVQKEKERILKSMDEKKNAKEEIIRLIEQDKQDRLLKFKYVKAQDSNISESELMKNNYVNKMIDNQMTQTNAPPPSNTIVPNMNKKGNDNNNNENYLDINNPYN